MQTIDVVNLFTAWLTNDMSAISQRAFVVTRLRTVSLSQLIHRGVMMLARVIAQAAELVSHGTRITLATLNLPATKATRAAPYTKRLVMMRDEGGSSVSPQRKKVTTENSSNKVSESRTCHVEQNSTKNREMIREEDECWDIR